MEHGDRVATITSKKANNWVDRGEPAWPTLERLLMYVFERHDERDRPWLAEHAAADDETSR